jgi:hypothetical protein
MSEAWAARLFQTALQNPMELKTHTKAEGEAGKDFINNLRTTRKISRLIDYGNRLLTHGVDLRTNYFGNYFPPGSSNPRKCELIHLERYAPVSGAVRK